MGIDYSGFLAMVLAMRIQVPQQAEAPGVKLLEKLVLVKLPSLIHVVS